MLLIILAQFYALLPPAHAECNIDDFLRNLVQAEGSTIFVDRRTRFAIFARNLEKAPFSAGIKTKIAYLKQLGLSEDLLAKVSYQCLNRGDCELVFENLFKLEDLAREHDAVKAFVVDPETFRMKFSPRMSELTSVDYDLTSTSAEIRKVLRAEDYNPELIFKVKDRDGSIIPLHRVNDKSLAGEYGAVYCYDPDCGRIIKLPKNSPALSMFQSEKAGYDAMINAGLPVAKIHNPTDNPTHFIKDFIRGPELSSLIKASSGKSLTKEQIESLANWYRRVKKHKVQIDFNPTNFIWSEELKQFVCIDPAPIASVEASAKLSNWRAFYFKGDLAGYLRFRAAILK